MSTEAPSPDRTPAPAGPSAGRVTVSLSTTSVYPHTCVDAFALAAELGYDGVEVMVWTDPVSQDPAALERLSEHYGIPVTSVHSPTLLVTQLVWGRAPWPKLRRSVDMARTLGASVVVVHPPFTWQREYAAGFVEGIAALEASGEVPLAVENMYPWRPARNGTATLPAYLPGWDPVPLPYRNVTLDLSHSATAGVSGLRMARDLGDRLAHLHLADGSGSGRDEHLVPGRGGQRCAEVLHLLGASGWGGQVVVEINTRRCRTRPALVADLAESLEFARRHLAAGRAAAAAGDAAAAGA